MSAYTITVWNDQGASEQHSGTRGDCVRWLATWADPETLVAELSAEGTVKERKEIGAIEFPPQPRMAPWAVAGLFE